MNTSGKLKCFWPDEESWSTLQQMDANYFPRPWNITQWKNLASEHHLIYLWFQNESPIGFALFKRVPGDETAHLFKICLNPEFRGKGAALSFWNHLLADLKNRQVQKIFLEVEEGNKVAQGFYRKVHFETLRTIKGYYSDGENALTMLLTL